jgi:hypothetical protein
MLWWVSCIDQRGKHTCLPRRIIPWRTGRLLQYIYSYSNRWRFWCLFEYMGNSAMRSYRSIVIRKHFTGKQNLPSPSKAVHILFSLRPVSLQASILLCSLKVHISHCVSNVQSRRPVWSRREGSLERGGIHNGSWPLAWPRWGSQLRPKVTRKIDSWDPRLCLMVMMTAADSWLCRRPELT